MQLTRILACPSVIAASLILLLGGRPNGCCWCQESADSPALRPLVNDRYPKDRPRNFKTMGEIVTAREGLRFSKDASIEYALNAGAWIESRFELQFPPLRGEGATSMTLVYLQTTGGKVAVVGWATQRRKDDLMTTLQVLDVSAAPQAHASSISSVP